MGNKSVTRMLATTARRPMQLSVPGFRPGHHQTPSPALGSTGAVFPGGAAGPISRLREDKALPTCSRDQVLVQRDVGFEFQTGWGIREVTGRKHGIGPKQYRPYGRQEVIKAYPGFNLTADEANTDLGAEIEFVVHHLIESKRYDMLFALATLERLAENLNKHNNRDRFTLDRATGNKADSSVEIHPKIKSAGPLSANPQLTGGIRLDRIVQMFTELGAGGAGDQHSQARSNLVATGGGGGLGNAAASVANLTRVDNTPASAECKGLVALLISYLLMGRLDMGGNIQQPTLNYGKASLTLLARTDFRRMFLLLPPPEQAYFSKHPTVRFVDWVLAAAGGLAADGNVIERGIHGKPVPITRRKWLFRLTRSSDLLKKETDQRLFGYGELDQKTDDVGANAAHKAPVVEFRTMKKNVAWDQWAAMGMGLFDYVRSINS